MHAGQRKFSFLVKILGKLMALNRLTAPLLIYSLPGRSKLNQLTVRVTPVGRPYISYRLDHA